MHINAPSQNYGRRINRTLSATYSYFALRSGVHLRGELLVAGGGGGEIVTAIAHPTQVFRWSGFQVHPAQGITVALKVPSPEEYDNPKNWELPSAARPFNPRLKGYYYFDGEGWRATETPIFQTISTVRSGMPVWSGPVQFHLKLEPGAQFEQLLFGYNVNLDLVDYLAEVAIPRLLRQTVVVSRININLNAGVAKLPTGFSPELIQSLHLQTLDSLPIEAKLQNKDIICPELKSPSSQFATLHITLIPHTEFARGLYQIEKIPSVVVRSRDPVNLHEFPVEEPVLVNDTESEVDKVLMGFDLSFDISVKADREKDARIITDHLMHHLVKEGKVYLPPFDLVYGISIPRDPVKGSEGITPFTLQGGTGASNPPDTVGALPTVNFQLLVRRLGY